MYIMSIGVLTMIIGKLSKRIMAQCYSCRSQKKITFCLQTKANLHLQIFDGRFYHIDLNSILLIVPIRISEHISMIISKLLFCPIASGCLMKTLAIIIYCFLCYWWWWQTPYYHQPADKTT